jgi:predicted nucleotidyltransferase
MSREPGPKRSIVASTTLPHDRAVTDFVDGVEAARLPGLRRLVLFGSVARSTHTDDSDVDVLAVVDDGADETAVEERLRDIAYGVMLEHGPAFSIHGVTESALERRSDHPFFRRALSDGRRIYG